MSPELGLNPRFNKSHQLLHCRPALQTVILILMPSTPTLIPTSDRIPGPPPPKALLSPPPSRAMTTPACNTPPATDAKIFSGNDGESVTTFLHQVQQVAFDTGRRPDDDWIICYVSSRLDGKAFVFWSSLDKETRDDWPRLREALISKYELGSSKSSPAARVR